jgi:hypothetical protein
MDIVAKRTCSVEGCEGKYHSKGYCHKHYWRLKNCGTVFLKTSEQRFWEKVRIGKPGECWEWQASLKNNGYGQFGLNGRVMGSHRASYIMNFGEIPARLDVCHKCDNPKCVNPNHLFLGTRSDNMQDCSSKGRIARGETVSSSKLTELQVIEIHSLKGSASLSNVARTYNVSTATIICIWHGKTWKHLKSEVV